ncbi:hypothetical protein [Rhodopirellula bahusiensis]|uniref:hypothetical protein n=1 Tax=Rhodopirellula bahusiensis TaxID=2014065 RepID=UPI0032640B71
MSNLKTSHPQHQNNEAQRYFSQLEGQIVQRLRVEASSDAGREELIRSTGIRDPELVAELGKLGVTADELVALRLFPLVLVAWAEKRADEHEREAVMAEALRLGIHEDSSAWVLLDQWLQKRPPGLAVDAWKRYIHEIFHEMSRVAQQRLILLTEKQMTRVAKASGGHLGFGKISASEKAIIQQTTAAMRHEIEVKEGT